MIGRSSVPRRARRGPATICAFVAFVALAFLACGDPTGPELGFEFQTAAAWLDSPGLEANYVSDGTIFPADWALPIGAFPGIEAVGAESSIQIRGMYIVGCIGPGADASIAASDDRLELTIEQGEGNSCAFAWDPYVFQADITGLDAGSYTLEMVYRDLVVDPEFGRFAEGETVFRSEVEVR